MVGRIGIAEPQIAVNGTGIGIVPNSAKYKPGLGEQSIVTESFGAGLVQAIFFDNAETKYSCLLFEVWAEEREIALVRTWKENANGNTIIITDARPNSDFKVTFQNMALITNYEVSLTFEGKIEVEFRGDQTTSIY